MDLKTTCRRIESLKIQGADNVARSALEALLTVVNKSKARDKEHFMVEIDEVKVKLFLTRPTEPAMRNYLEHVTNQVRKTKQDYKPFAKKLIKELLKNQKQSRKLIAKHGAKLAKNKTVFTHCHSGTAIDIIKKAKAQVHNTETRPLYQGRKTAKDLAKARIKVTHYTDSQARIALKHTDLMIIGADAITYNRVYNKVGSEMLAIIAKTRKVPVYIAASLWKFDPHKEIIEERSPKEVWERSPKGVKVMNYAFEKINFKLVKGIICEKGILRPKKFVKLARKTIL